MLIKFFDKESKTYVLFYSTYFQFSINLNSFVSYMCRYIDWEDNYVNNKSFI